MDLLGRERARLREELAALQSENEKLHDSEAKLRAQQQRTASGAARRQDKIAELEKVIDDLKVEVHARRKNGAPTAQISKAEAALRDAQAIHSDATR